MLFFDYGQIFFEDSSSFICLLSKAVNMTIGSSYKANGSEMSAKGTSSQKADITNSVLYLNKTRIYPLTYIIKNNNYVKLQDWAKAMDIKISYDNTKKLITVDTSQGYS